MDVRRRISGFTLLEILIAISIISLLASIGYPSYQQYIVTANRAAAQQFLLEAASVQQQYLLARNGDGYASQDALIGPGGLLSPPSSISTFYTITNVTNSLATDPPTFTVTATPIVDSIQQHDSELTINNIGSKTGAW